MARVLIVDDSEAQLYSLRRIVEGEGHQVITADNGEDGLKTAKVNQPDVILLDIVMPGMSGFQVSRKLRRDKETKGIPIIFVTTKNQETDRLWGLRQGASAYLTKPVDKGELLLAIGNALAA